MPTTTQAVLLGLLALFVAFLFPVLISAPTSGTAIDQATLEGPGADATVGDALRVNLDNKTADTAALNLTSLETGEAADLNMTETESTAMTLDGQQVTVTVLTIEPAPVGDVVVELRYPSNFAWDNRATDLSDNLPVVLSALAALIVLGLLGAVMRS